VHLILVGWGLQSSFIRVYAKTLSINPRATTLIGLASTNWSKMEDSILAPILIEYFEDILSLSSYLSNAGSDLVR
jgi:hypothetical protein